MEDIRIASHILTERSLSRWASTLCMLLQADNTGKSSKCDPRHTDRDDIRREEVRVTERAQNRVDWHPETYVNGAQITEQTSQFK